MVHNFLVLITTYGIRVVISVHLDGRSRFMKWGDTMDKQEHDLSDCTVPVYETRKHHELNPPTVAKLRTNERRRNLCITESCTT